MAAKLVSSKRETRYAENIVSMRQYTIMRQTFGSLLEGKDGRRLEAEIGLQEGEYK
jgi:hypothetical protein